jgi:hypothetical protein
MVSTFNHILQGSASMAETTTLTRLLISERPQALRGPFEFLIAHAPKDHLSAIDREVAAAIDAITPPEYGPSILAVGLLFNHGYRESLTTHARRKVNGKPTSRHSGMLIEEVSRSIACRGFPSIAALLGPGRFLGSGWEAVQSKTDAAIVYLASEEFARAKWHDGLQLWIDG